MQITQTVKLQRQSKDGTISMTVPKKFVNMYGWKPGDIVTIIFDTDNVDYIKVQKLD